jgi:tetratricopeptide (TPR) repeat protein
MGFPRQVSSTDTGKYDAIALFVQRAGRVRPGFDPATGELEQIANICQIAQGMPLAIELAAAWLHILNVKEIAEELEKGLDILSAKVRDTPERHHSIRAVFDHSWSLLDQEERETFKLLSVFRGGFTRQAAQQVTGASLQLLAELVNKSLLNHDPDSGRLEIHEMLRQYAQDRLEKTPEASITAQETHAAYFAEFMHQRWGHLKGPRQILALAEIEADIENVRAAWRYYLDQKNALKLWKFINGLWYVYWIRWWNHAGMGLFAEAVRALQDTGDEDAVALRGLAMAFQGYFMAWLDLADRGYELAKESVEILQRSDHPEALVLAYDSLGVNAYMLNRYSEEIIASNEMLKIATDLDDKWLLAFTLFAVSMGALLKEDYAQARRLADSNSRLNQEIGDLIGSTLPLIVLGRAALACGELESARDFYLRCLNMSERAGFHYAIQTSTKYLGKVTLAMGKSKEAEKYMLQSLRITKEIGFVRDIVNLFYEFARLRLVQNHPEQAVELLAFVLQHPASRQARMFEGRIRDSAEALLAKLAGELSPETYAAALERGQELELEGVIDDLVSPKRCK